ncbi:MAG: competence/damage-inducible protein A [Rubritalea sp.]|jgi:nicotinamide-nucleotide amidase|tara:strand:+ start:2117 stop:3358 length:1242 start_codon:yes stop_codon:yes gene_type:complete
MKIEIINTGSELLLGSTLNTHGAWLGQELLGLGLRVQRLITVPDGDPIRDALKQSIAVSDAVIITGGLGPTSDDVTREATAEALGVELIEDEHAVRCIEAFFANLGREMTPSNLKQALHPVGADVLPNPNGTAPGVYVPPRLGNSSCAIFLLPGPPYEMHAMYHAEVAPRLKALTELPVDHGVTNIKFSGVGESSFQDKLDAALHEIHGLEIGYCARPGELDLRLIGSESNRNAAANLAIKTYPQQYINNDGRSLEETVVHALTEKGLKLSLAESCTGGRISSRITDVQGSSAVFTHGFITYANQAKVAMIGVDEDHIETHGAVSEVVAKEMAEGALKHSGSDIAVSVTGIAGPTGGTKEKPVGTVWIGISVGNGERVETSAEMKFYPNGRAVFKQLASQAVLMKILRTVREY